MGSYNKKEKGEGNQQEQPKKIVKTWGACLLWFAVSMAGGLTIGWWEYEYHSTNSQQWMVPFGLILLVTPIFVWLAVFVSAACNSMAADNSQRRGQLVVESV